MAGLLDGVTDAQLDARRYRKTYAPSERDLYGAIATFVNPATGDLRTEAVVGTTARKAARLLAQWCLSLGADWRIRSLSHPLSVLHDLDNGALPRSRESETRLLGEYAFLIEYEQDWGGVTGSRRAEQRARFEQRRHAEADEA